MAKVMENLIQQNFEKKIFRQFSTGFSTILQKRCFKAVLNGSLKDFRGRKSLSQNHAEQLMFWLPPCCLKPGWFRYGTGKRSSLSRISINTPLCNVGKGFTLF
jgi:hypothetical protein